MLRPDSATDTADTSNAATSAGSGGVFKGFDLNQKFTLEHGRVLLTGTQALVRLAIDQHRTDAARGLHTATFISGYQGSPLGTFDLLIERNRKLLTDHEVVWVPGINEELAATAVWGSQEPLLGPLRNHDGVVGMWYGKGPGVDRCGDVFKHANFKGTAANGGVLALAGDDPMAKSSTLPTQTEPAFYDAQMPVLYPGTIQEILDLGLHGIALSRYSGLWVGFKIVTTLADALGTAEVGIGRVTPEDPQCVIDGARWQHVQRPGLVTPISLEQEKEIAYGRLEAAKAYAAANGINEISGATGDGARLGITAPGRTFYELRQALGDLGLGDAELRRYGIRLLRLGMVWPVEPDIVRRFAQGLRELLVLEEKRAFVELFVRDILYGQPDAPRVVGKEDETGHRLVPASGELTADHIAQIVARRITASGLGILQTERADSRAETAAAEYLGSKTPAMPAGTSTANATSESLSARSEITETDSKTETPDTLKEPLPARSEITETDSKTETPDTLKEPLSARSEITETDSKTETPDALRESLSARLTMIEAAAKAEPPDVMRTPYWCSGCPHNRSTAVPEGSIAGGGVGCHAMSLWIDDRALTVHQMGGEGATWIGRAPFTDNAHMFQNIGDGTFFHSGSLAVRAAVAAGINITYKILYNGAVAMTGGQDVAGAMPVPELTQSLAAEGASRIIVCSDNPRRYDTGAPMAAGVDVWDRDRLDEAQLLLRDTPGVTVLVYDQQCAAEKRRERKRGTMVTPTRRVFINEAVCEGCGDCGAKSHCLSVQPVDTELGSKTRIHQSSCNFDYTCIEGDCPSFIEVRTRQATAKQTKRTKTKQIKQATTKTARRQRAKTRQQTRQSSGIDGPLVADIPEPDRPTVGTEGFSVFMTGVGGTGVVTVSQVLATAGLLEGLDVSGLDQTGLSQKGGPVVSHLRFYDSPATGSNLIGAGLADCYLGFDLLVASDARNLAKASPERTTTVVSTSKMPTGDMVAHADEHYPDSGGLLEAIDRNSRSSLRLDSTRLAETLLGDHMPANVLTLGAAYQCGAIPVSAAAIEQALRLNGVAVRANIAAFRWGRQYALNAQKAKKSQDGQTDTSNQGHQKTLNVQRESDSLASPQPSVPTPSSMPIDLPGTMPIDMAIDSPGGRSVLDEVSGRASRVARELVRQSSLTGSDLCSLVQRRAGDLVDYQSAALARKYVDFVARVADREREVIGARVADREREMVGDAFELASAVAVGLYKLMAYKDEYEVARLHLRAGLVTELRTAIPNAVSYRILLHPPVLRALGLKRKLRFGRLTKPTLRMLRAIRRVRGTPFDLFGYSSMRRLERSLISEYRSVIESQLAELTPHTYQRAVRLARLPDMIRGYEHIKLASVERFREQVQSISNSDPAEFVPPRLNESSPNRLTDTRDRQPVTLTTKPARAFTSTSAIRTPAAGSQ